MHWLTTPSLANQPPVTGSTGTQTVPRGFDSCPDDSSLRLNFRVLLDFPSTEETCEQRAVSTIAPQALTFLNGEFIHEQAQAFAERLAREAGANPADRVVRAYRLAFARLPTDNELAAVLGFLARHEAQIAADAKGALDEQAVRQKALAALCLVLLNTNEFAYLQ